MHMWSAIADVCSNFARASTNLTNEILVENYNYRRSLGNLCSFKFGQHLSINVRSIKVEITFLGHTLRAIWGTIPLDVLTTRRCICGRDQDGVRWPHGRILIKVVKGPDEEADYVCSSGRVRYVFGMRYMHHTNRYPGNQIFVNYRVVIEEILPKVQLCE